MPSYLVFIFIALHCYIKFCYILSFFFFGRNIVTHIYNILLEMFFSKLPFLDNIGWLLCSQKIKNTNWPAVCNCEVSIVLLSILRTKSESFTTGVHTKIFCSWFLLFIFSFCWFYKSLFFILTEIQAESAEWEMCRQDLLTKLKKAADVFEILSLRGEAQEDVGWEAGWTGIWRSAIASWEREGGQKEGSRTRLHVYWPDFIIIMCVYLNKNNNNVFSYLFLIFISRPCSAL